MLKVGEKYTGKELQDLGDGSVVLLPKNGNARVKINGRWSFQNGEQLTNLPSSWQYKLLHIANTPHKVGDEGPLSSFLNLPAGSLLKSTDDRNHYWFKTDFGWYFKDAMKTHIGSSASRLVRIVNIGEENDN